MTGQSLANAVVSELNKRNMKISTAESCTGGLLAAAITSISGSSNVFEHGIISYANHVKQSELNVSGDSLEQFGAVSREVAIEMAKGIRTKANADVGISTTGVAGPTGGSDEKPVGTVHIAVATAKAVYHEKLSLLEECGNSRGRIREVTVEHALSLALRALQDE